MLAVLLRVSAVLYGNLGAAVQTSETHHAFVLDPDGLACLHFDGLHRAFLRAQSAAYAAVLHVKMRHPPRALVIDRLGYRLHKESRDAR